MSDVPGGKNSPQPNRAGSPRANVTGTRNGAAQANNGPSAALKGATLAFAARARRLSGESDSREADNSRGARMAAVIAGSRGGHGQVDHSPVRLSPHHEDPSSGSVRDSIKQFTFEDSEPRPSHFSQRGTDPQHVAAQLAVGRSTAHGTSHPLTKRSGDARGESLTLLYPNQDLDSESHMRRPGINQSTAGTEINLSTSSHSSTSMAMRSSANGRQEEPTEQGLSQPEKIPLSGGSERKPALPPRSAPSTAKNTGGALPAERPTKLPSVHAEKDVASREARYQSPLHQSRSGTHEDPAGISKRSLADAKTASSLASSRAPSPSKQIPPPSPPQRRPTTRSFLQPVATGPVNEPWRTPSPSKSLRQTMRDGTKSDDEDVERMRNKKNYRHHRERIMRPHPNKHNQANRKRWRERITDRERKRYEGVWAANKGLLLESDTQLQNTVVNVVVRDIWSRSRLAPALLGQIWDLVARDASVMVLSREEFAVGLWLIDQSLHGRKLPWKVPQSVWESVQQVQLSGLKQ